MSEPTMLVQCECGLTLRSDDPLPCFRCKPEEHDTRFVELTREAIFIAPLGHDPYRDGQYFWHDGKVYGIEGMVFRSIKYRHGGGTHDKLIADLTKMEAENRDLLAENARLRRRLDGK